MKKSKHRGSPTPETTPRFRHLDWAILLAVILFTVVVRVRLLHTPLERDEGEFAYMGQLVLQGVPPYKLAYNMKPPGIYAAYALVMALFGQSSAGVHLGLLLVNVATIVLVFLLARRLFGPYCGVLAGSSFALLSLSSATQGTAAHATHFVILPAVGGILVMLRAVESDSRKGYFAGGVLFGLAMLMKQPGVFFGLFAALYLVQVCVRERPLHWRAVADRLAPFALGFAALPAIAGVVLVATGVFPKFWFWNFTYASQYGTEMPLSHGLRQFAGKIGVVFPPSLTTWMLSLLGVAALFIDRSLRERKWLILSLVIFSFVAVCPGMFFRRHYFILLLPAAALLAGIAGSSVRRGLLDAGLPGMAKAVTVLLALALAYPVYQQWDFLFEATPFKASRIVSGFNPFPESVRIARYIKAHSIPEDQVAVVGSEPQIYFYSNRKSATGYIYTYGLVERQKYALHMQREMIREIEASKPEFLVSVNVVNSWLPKPGADDLIIRWVVDYARRYYEPVGLVDMVDPDYSDYYWGRSVRSAYVQSPAYVSVFRRRSGE